MSHIIQPAAALIAVRCTFLKVSAPLSYREIYHARIGFSPRTGTYPHGSLLVRYGDKPGQWRHYPREWFMPLNPRNDFIFGALALIPAAA